MNRHWILNRQLKVNYRKLKFKNRFQGEKELHLNYHWLSRRVNMNGCSCTSSCFVLFPPDPIAFLVDDARVSTMMSPMFSSNILLFFIFIFLHLWVPHLGFLGKTIKLALLRTWCIIVLQLFEQNPIGSHQCCCHEYQNRK